MLARDMSGSGEVLDMTKAGIAARKRKIHEMGARLREDELLGETAAERRAYIRSVIRRATGRARGPDGRSCRCPLCRGEDWRPVGAPERRHPRHCVCTNCLALSAMYRTGD